MSIKSMSQEKLKIKQTRKDGKFWSFSKKKQEGTTKE